ncbi:MAG: ATP synthase F0 subunit C [Deltaproteobacteria bacterium]|jgi:F-type H+-transporting ATPase subunit c|nr:ATP synthase F0 subunit C [Deltaproteobacteria bacterium]MBK8236219.1 ATP synthase F0 subunit C [Deltaproteobacteria bacterium]MBK8713825.1 ATP synthase F0 subunit C [Deltaproteobacteria bacterium]MBP7291046.1 ATP synthase F0 subunit C [Nannocystaceae bacterium]
MTNNNARIAKLVAFATAFLAPAIAAAAPAAAGAAAQSSGPNDGIYAIAMGFGMGIAALGCGMGQGKAAGAALEGICRNPNSADKVFTPMLLGLAFIESLVIFTFVIAFMIFGRFGF